MNRSRSHIFPISEILSRSGDIRDQSRKLCKIDPNFTDGKNFRGGPSNYKVGANTDDVVRFRGDRPTEIGDPEAN